MGFGGSGGGGGGGGGGGAPSGAAGGDLDLLYPNPNVKALHETGAGTQLVFGAIPDNLFTKRVGTTLIGQAITADDIGPAFAPSLSGGGTVEVGVNVPTPAFTVSYSNGPPDSATLTDADNATPESLVTPFTSKTSGFTFHKTANNASVLFTLSAIKGALTRTSNVAYTWEPRVFFGVSSNAAGNTEAFIEALASQPLAPSRSRSFTLAPAAGEYIYYAYPTSYGVATFTVGGFVGGFNLISTTVSVTNGFGVTQNYTVYRSTNPSLGSTAVVVS